MKGFYIKHKARLFIVLFLLLFMQVGVTIDNISDEIYYENKDKYFYIEASYGDTIWSLTKRYWDYIDSFDENFRLTVDMIIDINGGYKINEGDLIKFPKK